MRIRTEIAVVGSGAGGATVAKELAGRGKDVLIVERGPYVSNIGTQRAGLGFYDRCGLRTSKEGIIVYRTLMVGGTTVVSCGSGVRVLEKELKDSGLDLAPEFEETEKELGVRPLAERLIGPGSRLIMDAANRLGFEMRPMPKFIDPEKCVSCGRCVLGCKTGAKWTTLNFVNEALQKGARIITRVEVRSVVSHKGRAVGLVGAGPEGKIRIYADRIILAAGGISSPVILKRSGIENAGKKLFTDLFNVTYGIYRKKDINLWNEPSMAALSTKHMQSKGFIMAPFIDVPLVLRGTMSKRRQIKNFRHNNLLGIMVKTKDESAGKITTKERFEKLVTPEDHKKLDEGAGMAKDILMEAGVKKKDIILTKPRGAHPGGSAAIGEVVDKDLETEIRDLYVCDASVLPTSPGAPPIVTIVALAKKLAKKLAGGMEQEQNV